MVKKLWTEDILKDISEDAKTLTISQIAKKYDVPYKNMYAVFKRYGITNIPEKPRWTREVKEFIFNNRELSCKELAEITGKDESSVRNLLNQVYGPRWRFFLNYNPNGRESKL